MQELFEKIIEELEIERTTANNTFMKYEMNVDLGRVFGLEKAIEIVKQEAEKSNNGWIPCDGVHFPEENVYVRVTTWTETEKIGFRRDGKWFVYGSDGLTEATVLAWQPTEPYQSKGE